MRCSIAIALFLAGCVDRRDDGDPAGSGDAGDLPGAGVDAAVDAAGDATPEPALPSIAETETVRAGDAGRVAWSPTDVDTIAFDARNPERTDCAEQICFDVYIRDPGGERCVTCAIAGLVDRRNRGQPAFHPSGDWLVIQVEEAGSDGAAVTRPGGGVRNELWLVSLDGAVAYPLRYAGDDEREGVLHPHFSPDGTLLAWAEKYQKPGPGECTLLGCWRVRIAELASGDDGVAQLVVRPPVMPLGEGFYETHDFTPDGSELLITSSGGQGLLSADIYALGVGTGVARQLTSSDYNEHAHVSPDGRWITWMSTAQVPGAGADLWIMTAAGDRRARLTRYNDENPLNAGINVSDHEWSPRGDQIVQYIADGDGAIVHDLGSIAIFTLD